MFFKGFTTEDGDIFHRKCNSSTFIPQSVSLLLGSVIDIHLLQWSHHHTSDMITTKSTRSFLVFCSFDLLFHVSYAALEAICNAVDHHILSYAIRN